MNTRLNKLNRIIKPLGFMIKRSDSNDLLKQTTMYGAIQRSKKIHKIEPVTVIDVGAAEGKWTLMAMNVWPESNYVVFEPLTEREEILLELEKRHRNIHFVNKAAGKSNQVIDFYVTADLDGSGISENGTTDSSLRKVAVTSIDEEIRHLQLKGPFIIKLDTHGYEVPIIEGAEISLKETQLLIIECYGLRIAPISLLFWEMCSYLEDKGFRLIDIVDISLRPKDGAFWQCDAFFIPDNSKCFFSNTYI